MVYCQRCGTENQDEAQFWTQCGASLFAFIPCYVDVHEDKRGGTSLDMREAPGGIGPVMVESEALRGNVHKSTGKN